MLRGPSAGSTDLNLQDSLGAEMGDASKLSFLSYCCAPHMAEASKSRCRKRKAKQRLQETMLQLASESSLAYGASLFALAETVEPAS